MSRDSKKNTPEETSGESIQTDAAPVQPQPPTTSDGTTAETALVAASEEATTILSQPIAAEHTDVATSQCATSVAQPAQEADAIYLVKQLYFGRKQKLFGRDMGID